MTIPIERLPLSAAQQPLWLGHQMDPASPAYSVAAYVAIDGTIRSTLLERALRAVLAETDALRMTIVAEPETSSAAQVVAPEVVCPLREVSFAGVAEPIAAARKWMERDLAVAVDLDRGPLLSTALLRFEDARCFWYVKSHHVALDGYALTLFIQRVAEVYSSMDAPPLMSEQGRHWQSRFAPLKVALDDEQAYRASPAFAADREFWRHRYNHMGAVPSLTDEVKFPAARALLVEAEIPGADKELLAELAGNVSAHLVTGVIAAFATFISRSTGCEQIVIGVPFLNRGGRTARVPCTRANVLPMHLRLPPAQTTDAVVAGVTAQLAEMRVHQQYRAEDIRRDCQLVGDGRRLTGPQINVDVFSEPVAFGAATARPHVLSAGPVDDFGVLIQPGLDGAGLRVLGMANRALYSQRDLELHIERFVRFVHRFATSAGKPIGRLDVGTDAELAEILGHAPSDARVEASGTPTLIDLFERRVAEVPDAVALTWKGENLHYAEVNARANRLAREIQARVPAEVGPNPLVALLLSRSPETVIAILAVLKAGAAYVPIDPDAPPGRIEAVLGDTAPALVVTEIANLERLPAKGERVLALDEAEARATMSRRAADDLSRSCAARPAVSDRAYVIYTSGSTGQPKGVQITHRNVVRLFQVTNGWFGYRADDVWTMCHSYIFDASVWEMWGALLHGARLVIVPPEVTRSPEDLLALVAAEKVTVFGQIPSAFYRFIEAEQDRPELAADLSLRYQCFGGEALDIGRLRPWFQTRRKTVPRLLNMYGITETTINATYHFVSESEAMANEGSLIGRPYDDLRVLLLDDALRPVCNGVCGEIYVAGEGLAPGYLRRPELDAVRFVANPFGPPGSRMYRSGDVAVRREAGTLEYVGRSDQQVKLRGYRIELGEIEAQLRDHPAISDAVASVRLDATGDPQLAAYVVPLSEGQADVDPVRLREYLRERLPSYMVPAAIGVLATLPITATGKVDRQSLPAIVVTAERTVTPARDGQDEAVLAVWRRHLDLKAVGIDDNFFDVGGDSIKAIRVCRELDIPVMALFDDPTPRACADRIRARGSSVPEEQSLLRRLAQPQGAEPALSLLCIPFAGGTPVAYRELASSLQGAFSCWSVALPGHDPTAEPEDTVPLAETADRIVAEILRQIPGPIAIYGHCAGNALALAIAERLERSRTDIVAVVIGGMLMDDNPGEVLERVLGQSGGQILAFLRTIGGFKEDLDLVTLARIEQLTHHDSVETARFFAGLAKAPSRLRAPIHVVVGDQDPLTARYEARYLDWRALADEVTLSVIPGGGHYFVTDQPGPLAAVLQETLERRLPPASRRRPRVLREFRNPFDADEGTFFVLTNLDGQTCLWPAFAQRPSGWEATFGPTTRRACLEAVDKHLARRASSAGGRVS